MKVESELKRELQGNADFFIETLIKAREEFQETADAAKTNEDEKFDSEGACQRFNLRVRRALSLLKEEDIIVLSSYGLIK